MVQLAKALLIITKVPGRGPPATARRLRVLCMEHQSLGSFIHGSHLVVRGEILFFARPVIAANFSNASCVVETSTSLRGFHNLGKVFIPIAASCDRLHDPDERVCGKAIFVLQPKI